MRLVFGSCGKEAADINSGKFKSITREIDWHDPRFKEIEDINGRMALYKHSNSLCHIGSMSRWGDLGHMIYMGHKTHFICIEDECDIQAKIIKISYMDGKVTIEWEGYNEM